MSDYDPETICCDPESYSNGDIGEKREEDNRETQEALQTQTAYGKDFNTEEEENVNTHAGERDIASRVMKRQTGGCGGINNHAGESSITVLYSCSISRHNGDYDDKNIHSGETDASSCGTTKPTEISDSVVAGLNGFVDQMALDRKLERELERLAGLEGKTEKTNSVTPVRSSDMHCYSEEGCLSLLSLLSSAPVPHSSSETPEPSTPVEGSTSAADNETTWDREEQEKDTSDGKCNSNNNNNEERLERDGLGKRNTGIVDEEELDKRFAIHLSSSVAVDKEELCAEGKLLEVADTVKETLTEPVSELSTHTEDTQLTSEEARGPCKQPGETLYEVREEEEEEGDGQVEEGNTTSPLFRQVEGHSEVDACVLETDRGIVRAAEEEDFARREVVESKGTELNEKREDGQRDELNEEYREENKTLEQVKDNLVEGERTVKEVDETEEIWREVYSEALRDGGIKRGDVEEHDTDEKLNEWADGHGKEQSYRENNREVKRDCMTKEDWRIQESAEEWRTEDMCAPPLPEETGGERGRGETGEACSSLSLSPTVATTTTPNAASADPTTSLLHAPANPAPPRLPLGAMTTGLPCLEVGGARAAESEGKGGSEGGGGVRVVLLSSEEQGQERDQELGSTVATEQERGRQEEKEEEGEREEEDEFGMFMQAEEESAWSEGFIVSASVPCGNRESAALGNHGIADESTYWTSSWTDSSFHHSEDTWTAFPQDSLDEGRDAVGQWWPINAVEEMRDRLSTNQNLSTVFAEAFPSLPVPSCCDSDAIPTLTQLLREDPNCSTASQDQGLLDNFHDLNKMIGQRYKRANGVSRDLLLQSLHLDHTYTDSRTGPWTANHRLSPGLPSSNQHVPTAAAKRRLSYDYNKNIME